MREASKQSIRPWLPSVAELTSTKQLAALAGETRMLLLEPTASVRLTEVAGTVSGENGDSDHPLDIVLVVRTPREVDSGRRQTRSR